MKNKRRLVSIIGFIELLRKLLVFLNMYGIVILAFLIGGTSVLVAYEKQPERVLDQTLIVALIYFVFLNGVILALRFEVLSYLKRRIWKEIAKDIETQVLSDNAGHSLEVQRLKNDSDWRQLVWPYREAKNLERGMGLPRFADGEKWTRQKAIAARNKYLQETYDYAEKHGLAYVAPFYLRCYGTPKIAEPDWVDDEEVDAVEQPQDSNSND